MNDTTKKTLVIGDWTIDENWVCGIQRSSISSRTGMLHLRGLNENEGAIESLCGAGATASIIHRAKPGNDIIGVGMWHFQDTEYLSNMVHSALPQSKNGPHRHLQSSGQYTRKVSESNESGESDSVNLIQIPNESKEKPGTIKVIRIYQHTGIGSNVSLIARIDWESSPLGDEYWIKSENTANDFVRKIENDHNDINAIVIKCLNKKVVSEMLVEALSKNKTFKALPWYVSSKYWEPSWFKYLKNVNCKLLIIPQPAVDTAKRDRKSTKWINRKGFATKKALLFLENMRQQISNDKNEPLIVVLPSGHRILAIGRVKDSINENKFVENAIIIQLEKQTIRDPMPVETPFASILFGALIVQLMNNMNRKIDDKLIIKNALGYTQKYIKSENKRITEPEKWKPGVDEIYFDIHNENSYKIEGNVKWIDPVLTIENAKKMWEEAMSGNGIINSEHGKTIQLFRGDAVIDNYISLNWDNNIEIQNLVIHLQQFKRNQSKKSHSCMIIAPPGTGKTMLAKSLSKYTGFNLLEFNISQMYSRENIIDMFDRITTEQAKSPAAPLLVFIDEINSDIEGGKIYSYFLSPLEEGIYERSEKSFHLQPCYWVFAGTEKPTESKSNKAEDFESRLTLPFVFLGKAGEDIAGLESVYVCTSILTKTFPDVRWVTEKVLKLFNLLGTNKGISLRQKVQLIRSFQDIKRGLVLGLNIPYPKLRALCGDWINSLGKQEKIFGCECLSEDNWKNITEGDQIEIVSE